MSSRARILVIDDEPYISRIVARTLRDDYDVSTASSAAEALAVLRSNEPFALILCDLMMPGMSGMDLYDAVMNERPDLAARMVFLTGGATTARAASFLETMENRVVEKPFTSPSLLATVSALLKELA